MLTFFELAFLAILYLGPATWSVYHVLLYKRDPRAAMSWIIICVFVPYGGPIGYFLFGINRVRTRARSIRRGLLAVEYEGAGDRPFARPVVDELGLRAIGERITGVPLLEGNAVEAIHNGENAYPAMLASIEGAKHRVLLATFILKMDRTGARFVDALEAAVSRGVEVLVLIDGVGELYSWKRPSKYLNKRGIRTARFLPPRLLPPSIYVNLRNHRKILIVDQEVAYAGGMNIGDENVSEPGRPGRVTDVHFSLRGPIVDALAEIFYRDWHFTTGTQYRNDDLPQPEQKGGASCRAIPDGPDAEMDSLALAILAVVSSAVRHLDIMTPYFLPSRDLIGALQAAALRGVRVRVILPGKNNLFYVHWANRNILAELLKSGIEVYYQPAPFCHSKLLCVDDEYSLIGSANLDPRSLRLNYELGVEVFSGSLTADLRAHMERVVAVSAPISHEQLTTRSVWVRLRDSFVALFTPYL